ncbi:hypothetical protein ABQE45_08655 [Mycobacteroides chelonae]
MTQQEPQKHSGENEENQDPADEVQEQAEDATGGAEPTIVHFSDEESGDVTDEVEPIKLDSNTLGAIAPRRC